METQSKTNMAEITEPKSETELSTVKDLEDRLRSGAEKSKKEVIKSELENTSEVYQIADRLPEGFSIEITSEGDVFVSEISESLRYQPEFKDEPREDKLDWAFFINGKFAGWNTMSGGLSNIKGYKFSPSKIMDEAWEEKDEFKLSLYNPKKNEEYDVLVLSERRMK